MKVRGVTNVIIVKEGRVIGGDIHRDASRYRLEIIYNVMSIIGQ